MTERAKRPAGWIRAVGRLGFAVFLAGGAVGWTGTAHAFTWPWETGGPWPTSSEQPVQPLDRPSVEAIGPDQAPARALQFAVFGDQRALADGEWQSLIAAIVEQHRRTPLRFLLDTGDIVNDGRHTDQFAFLHEILRPSAGIPYLVGVGNHEVDNNKVDNGTESSAREHTARFLSPLDSALSAERLYYDKRLGPLRMVFMDTNDLVYGDTNETRGVPPASPPSGSRAETQMRWLVERLASFEVAETVILVMHHPFIHTSRKHQESAVGLWSYTYQGRRLPDILLDAGVDLILAGHTHTYERFRIERSDGRALHLVNVSGRPRSSFLWIGAGVRRPRDIRGSEMEWLAEEGWQHLEGWRVSQEDVMIENERNQFALFDVDDMGSLSMRVFFVDKDGMTETGERVYFE